MLKKTQKNFIETFKNYVSYIQTFSLTVNYQNSRNKEKKKRKKLTLNKYSIN